MKYARIQSTCQLRSVGDGESRRIEGKAISFGTQSNIMRDVNGTYFREVLQPGCITQDIINRSDILFTYNHDPHAVLARWKRGEGTLDVELREDGVYFSFDAPNTTLGNDCLEEIRVGNLTQCSFAFDLPAESNAFKFVRSADGHILKYIYRINQLYDLSMVFNPAYDDTFIETRNQDLEDLRNLDENEVKEEETRSEEEENKPENSEEEETRNDEENKPEQCEDPQNEDEETRSDDEENKPENSEEETRSDDDPQNEDEETRSDDEENKPENSEDNEETRSDDEPNINNKEDDEETRSTQPNENKTIRHIDMNLIHVIKDLAEGKGLSAELRAIDELGKKQTRNAGLSYVSGFNLPYETRGAITVAAEGEDVVQTDVFDVLGPLREKNVLVQAGCRFLTGLVGDVQIPVYSGTSADWKGEVAQAGDGAGEFTSVPFSPFRLTTSITISRQFLLQDSASAEEMLRSDIIDSINTKLEATLLGDENKTSTKPAGIFYNATLKDFSTFAGIADAEADVEEAGVFGECKYIVSPKMKAALRTTQKGNGVGFVMENGAIDGTPALSTAHVKGKKAVYGDFKNYAIANWGSISLIADPYTLAKNDEIVLVVSAYFDAKPLRNGVFAFGEIPAAPAEEGTH